MLKPAIETSSIKAAEPCERGTRLIAVIRGKCHILGDVTTVVYASIIKLCLMTGSLRSSSDRCSERIALLSASKETSMW